MGSLAGQSLWLMDYDAGGKEVQRAIVYSGARIRDVDIDPADGSVIITTEPGNMVRLFNATTTRR